MYLCKRKAYKFCNLVTLIFLSVTIISCSFSPINPDTKIIVSKVKFDISVPEKIRNNINTFIIEKDLSTKEVTFSEFKFKENNFFGGENLGSLESEVTGSIQIKILNGKENTKKISSIKRFNTQSLNPLAQKELIKIMHIEIIEDLNKKILLYLKIHEDKQS